MKTICNVNNNKNNNKTNSNFMKITLIMALTKIIPMKNRKVACESIIMAPRPLSTSLITTSTSSYPVYVRKGYGNIPNLGGDSQPRMQKLKSIDPVSSPSTLFPSSFLAISTPGSLLTLRRNTKGREPIFCSKSSLP